MSFATRWEYWSGRISCSRAACIRATQEFLASVRAEAIDNVKRLRNHPSIVLWAGNNEVEDGLDELGLEAEPAGVAVGRLQKIFHGVLAGRSCRARPDATLLAQLTAARARRGSGLAAQGDVHFWRVWHAAEPFSEYEKQHPRFMSEYGFQSFPNIETVNYYTVPDRPRHRVADHARAPEAPARQPTHTRVHAARLPEPKDFESFLYVSQVLQAEGIRIGAEHLRRIMPHNMGSLYWQINDCWPVASWSSIDYFGRWKALQYYARRFYSDLLVSPTCKKVI
jgi:beta-mannosidase